MSVKKKSGPSRKRATARTRRRKISAHDHGPSRRQARGGPRRAGTGQKARPAQEDGPPRGCRGAGRAHDRDVEHHPPPNGGTGPREPAHGEGHGQALSAGAAPARCSLAGARPGRLPHALAPYLPAAAARQNIASYAHLYGVVLTRKDKPVGTIAPAALCRILREAIEATTEGRRERAETVVRSIALRIVQAGGEPLAVPRVALDVLRRLTLAARLATATPPACLPIAEASSSRFERAGP